MSASALPTDRLHSAEEPLASYRAISRAAIASLGLGLASVLTLVTPVLAIIPLGGIATAVLALRNIAQAGGQLTGRGLATLGLCLCTLFLGWGVARHTSRKIVAADHAQRHVEQFLQLVREGNLQAAHQYLLAADQRARTPEEVESFYKTNPNAIKDSNTFFGNAPIRDFIAQGKDVNYRLEALVSQQHSANVDRMVFRYSFDVPGQAPKQMWITVWRSVNERNRGHWAIQSVEAELPIGVPE